MSLRLPLHAINLWNLIIHSPSCTVPAGATALAFATVPDLPAGWTIVRTLPNAQIVWNGPVPPEVKHSAEDLSISYIDEMLALTELNELGRFRERAPELGSYLGIHESGQLVAMAGKDSDSLDSLRSVLSAPIQTTGAVDMGAHLSLRSYRRSRREVRLLSFTLVQIMLKQYVYMRNSASRLDSP